MIIEKWVLIESGWFFFFARMGSSSGKTVEACSESVETGFIIVIDGIYLQNIQKTIVCPHIFKQALLDSPVVFFSIQIILYGNAFQFYCV